MTEAAAGLKTWFEQGHQASLAGKSALAVEAWLRCWEVFLHRLPAGRSSIEAAQVACPELEEPLLDWLRDVDEDLAEAGIRGAAWRERRLAFCQEVLERLELDDERLDFLCSQAASLWDLKRRDAAEQLFEETARAWPEVAGAFVRWGDCWAFDRPPDFERAEAIYRRGLEPPEQCDLRTIKHRLAMLERLRESADEKAAKKKRKA